jgi:hypothetical protein
MSWLKARLDLILGPAPPRRRAVCADTCVLPGVRVLPAGAALSATTEPAPYSAFRGSLPPLQVLLHEPQPRSCADPSSQGSGPGCPLWNHLTFPIDKVHNFLYNIVAQTGSGNIGALAAAAVSLGRVVWKISSRPLCWECNPGGWPAVLVIVGGHAPGVTICWNESSDCRMERATLGRACSSEGA